MQDNSEITPSQLKYHLTKALTPLDQFRPPSLAPGSGQTPGTPRPLDGTPVPSDYDLNPGMRRPAFNRENLKPAAVLITVRVAPDPVILFTVRAKHLQDHPGQISFPGGKIDTRDPTPCHTAIREANEELGIEPELITPVGYLDCYETRTGFLIAPLVALLDQTAQITPDPSEVDEWFEVPVAYLLNPANIQKHSRPYEGVERFFYALPYQRRYIWGATAGMLVNMQKRLYDR